MLLGIWTNNLMHHRQTSCSLSYPSWCGDNSFCSSWLSPWPSVYGKNINLKSDLVPILRFCVFVLPPFHSPFFSFRQVTMQTQHYTKLLSFSANFVLIELHLLSLKAVIWQPPLWILFFIFSFELWAQFSTNPQVYSVFFFPQQILKVNCSFHFLSLYDVVNEEFKKKKKEPGELNQQRGEPQSGFLQLSSLSWWDDVWFSCPSLSLWP